MDSSHSTVPHVDMSLSPKDVTDDQLRALLFKLRPEVPVSSDVQIKQLTGGFINVMYELTTDAAGATIIRIFASHLQKMFDRKREMDYLIFLQNYNLHDRIYGTFSNGMCYRFRRGRCLEQPEVSELSMTRLIAKKMAKLHVASLQYSGEKTDNLVDSIAKYFATFPDRYDIPEIEQKFKEYFPDIADLRQEYNQLISHLLPLRSSKYSGPLVLCHSDLTSRNIIFNETDNEVHFIDYEFSGFGYQGDEIGAFLIEFAGLNVDTMTKPEYPTEAFQLQWIKIYMEYWRQFTRKSNETGSEHDDSAEDAISDDDVWNLYVSTSKFSLLRPWYCLSWVLTATMEHTDPEETVSELKFAKAMITGYYSRKDAALKLQYR